MSGTAKSYQDRTQLKCRRSAVSPARSSARKPNVFSALGIECSFASTSTVASCSSRWRSAGASANQLLPKVYGMTSGGTTPSTWSITKNGRPQDVAGVLDPAHPRDRDVGQLADLPDHLELVVKSIRREYRHVLGGGRHPRHQLLLDRLAVLLPARGQDDGFRRHSGGVHAALHGHLAASRRRAARWTAIATSPPAVW